MDRVEQELEDLTPLLGAGRDRRGVGVFAQMLGFFLVAGRRYWSFQAGRIASPALGSPLPNDVSAYRIMRTEFLRGTIHRQVDGSVVA